MNLINLNRSPLLAFVKGFFRKPNPKPLLASIEDMKKDATRIIFLSVYDATRSRLLYRTKVKCPVSAAPARIAARVATIRSLPDRARIWMTDDTDRAQNWQYRYRMIRRTDGNFHARLIDPRTR